MRVLDQEAKTLSTLAELLRLQLSPGQPGSDPNDRPDPSLGPAAAARLLQGESRHGDGHNLVEGWHPRHRATAAHAQRWHPAPGGGRAQPGALLQRGASAWPALAGSQPPRPAVLWGQSGDGQQRYSGRSLQPAAGAELAFQDDPNSGFAFSAEEPSGVTRPGSFGTSSQLSSGSWVSSPSDAPDPGTAVEWVDAVEPDFGHAIAKDAYAQDYFRPMRRADTSSSEASPGDGFTAPGASPNIGAPFVVDAQESDDDDLMEDARPRRGTIDAPREFVSSSSLAAPAARSRRHEGSRQLSSDEERMQSLLDTGNYAGF